MAAQEQEKNWARAGFSVLHDYHVKKKSVILSRFCIWTRAIGRDCGCIQYVAY